MTVSNFDNLGLSASLLRAVAAEGYHTATPIQVAAIPEVLRGRDLMGCAQTGTGKTAAFALPTLQRLGEAFQIEGEDGERRRRMPRTRPIRTLVLAPTRELAAQIAEGYKSYGRFTGMRTAVVYGGVSKGPQIRALEHGVDVLVATPGRLLDLMQEGHIELRRVEILVLDEADQMLDMGFIRDLRRIVAAVPRDRQTLMFSATMPDSIRQLANQWLRNPARVEVAPVCTPIELVAQSVYMVEPKNKTQLLAHLLQGEATGRTLVFARTKHGADKIVRQLVREGINALAIHGNKSQGARERVLKQFKSTRPPVLVATDIAARGLDVDDVNHVINYELPEVAEIYVHRIGRTGRAGAVGAAISFCGAEERSRLRTIERHTRSQLTVERNHPVYKAVATPPPSATVRGGNGPRGRKPSSGGSRTAAGAATATVSVAKPKAKRGVGMAGRAATGLAQRSRPRRGRPGRG